MLDLTPKAVEQASWWRRWIWRHPEWWSLSLSLIAWLSFLRPRDHFAGLHALHVHHHGPTLTTLFLFGGELISWTVMVVAMMLPLTVNGTRVTAVRSLWARRHRAILFFILGYLSAWLLAGMIVCGVIVIFHTNMWFRPTLAVSAAFSSAALWEFTTAKRRALRSCHRTIPLAPRGWRATADCLRYGWVIGGNCLVNCGALMLACTMARHSMAAMVGTGSIMVVERYGTRPKPAVISAAIASLGLICIFLIS